VSNRPLTGAAEQFVERMGLLWEGQGLPRIAGRMLGFLTLQGEPATLDEIAAALGVSKASVSVDARRLERLGLVDRVSRPGDRRDYYVIGEDLLAHALELRLESMRRLQDVILAAGRVPDTPPRVRRRLGDMARHHEHALRAVESLLDELRVPTPDTVDSTD